MSTALLQEKYNGYLQEYVSAKTLIQNFGFIVNYSDFAGFSAQTLTGGITFTKIYINCFLNNPAYRFRFGYPVEKARPDGIYLLKIAQLHNALYGSQTILGPTGPNFIFNNNVQFARLYLLRDIVEDTEAVETALKMQWICEYIKPGLQVVNVKTPVTYAITYNLVIGGQEQGQKIIPGDIREIADVLYDDDNINTLYTVWLGNLKKLDKLMCDQCYEADKAKLSAGANSKRIGYTIPDNDVYTGYSVKKAQMLNVYKEIDLLALGNSLSGIVVCIQNMDLLVSNSNVNNLTMQQICGK